MKENEVSQSHFDRVLIAIPSLGRPMAILKKTFALVNGAGIPFKIFVEKQEEFLYKHYCGYNNVEHFCRQFRQYNGCTPGQFRKDASKQKEADFPTHHTLGGKEVASLNSDR